MIFDPLTQFDEALEHIAAYMWPTGEGYTEGDREALRRFCPVSYPEPEPKREVSSLEKMCRGEA